MNRNCLLVKWIDSMNKLISGQKRQNEKQEINNPYT